MWPLILASFVCILSLARGVGRSPSYTFNPQLLYFSAILQQHHTAKTCLLKECILHRSEILYKHLNDD